jgi:hypothetical protein
MEIFWIRSVAFPDYSISNFGDVVNEVTERLLRQNVTLDGVAKVDLFKDGIKYTRSVKRLVAEAFVEGRIENFDTPINLDGDKSNNRVDNLMWRPRWFAMKYTHQFDQIPDIHRAGPIRDVRTRDRYFDVYEAGTFNGILFKDIWRSINDKIPTQITNQVFEKIRPRS